MDRFTTSTFSSDIVLQYRRLNRSFPCKADSRFSVQSDYFGAVTRQQVRLPLSREKVGGPCVAPLQGLGFHSA